MLKRVLILCTLTACGFMSLQATECAIPPVKSGKAIEKGEKESEKDNAPGHLACNKKVKFCTKDEEKEESQPGADLSSLFDQGDKKDEEKLLACSKCR